MFYFFSNESILINEAPEIDHKLMYQKRKGKTGLKNMGNTCFMNSVLQCIIHTPSIKEHFLSDPQNELHQNGKELKEIFSKFVKSMWSGKDEWIEPFELKMKINELNEKYIELLQYDAAEFLQFFLFSLHEDLNKVIEKPYIPSENVFGVDLELASKKCWEDFKKREDSFIIDQFYSQFLSCFKCMTPQCRNQSIYFHNYFLLPLEISNAHNISQQLENFSNPSFINQWSKKFTFSTFIFNFLSQKK